MPLIVRRALVALPLFALAMFGWSSPVRALTPAQQDYCIQAAAIRYQVAPDLIRAIIRTEGGTTGQTVGNTNGSRDMGLMQINTIHLPELARLGITRQMIVNDECLNIQIGTFILHRELARGGDFWTNVGAYNSRTPVHNVKYRTKVWSNLLKIWGRP